MALSIRNSRRHVSEADIVEAEVRIAREIPQGYRNFLLQHNGGVPSLRAFDIYNWSSIRLRGSILTHFASIDPQDTWRIDRYLSIYQGRLPTTLFPFGRDMGGNLLCMSEADATRGAILYWDHEEERTDGGEPWMNNVYYVANSLSAFLESLKSVT